MKNFVFVVETRGTKTFEVEAASREEAAKLLANCDSDKKYLIESEDDWNINDWSSDPLHIQLLNYIEDEYESE